jgi:hypothetical protein
MENDYIIKNVRTAAILTTSYVAGTILENTEIYDKLAIYADFTKGSLTTAEIKVEFAATLYYALGYDGQSANFTVGKTLTGASSGATAVIIADTDSGATGTLTIRKTNNLVFLDNETITDDNSTPGTAVANGVESVSSYTFYQETTSAEALKERAMSATGKYRFGLIDIRDRYIRISAKGTGTVDSSSLAISAILSQDV